MQSYDFCTLSSHIPIPIVHPSAHGTPAETSPIQLRPLQYVCLVSAHISHQHESHRLLVLEHSLGAELLAQELNKCLITCRHNSRKFQPLAKHSPSRNNKYQPLLVTAAQWKYHHCHSLDLPRQPWLDSRCFALCRPVVSQANSKRRKPRPTKQAA